jgi:ATP-dependent NAD(P)H-hydrate dehydratase
MSPNDKNILRECKQIIPNLLDSAHKGNCGRIGVFGGSEEFTGAPYFASISALKTGADLVYVFTHSSAAPIIKSYSPELMVMPFLDNKDAVNLISPWMNRLHAVAIGPGLGRNPVIFRTILHIIEELKKEKGPYRPLIFDADGLYLIMNNLDVLRDYPGEIYLTPNHYEFMNLAAAILGANEKTLEENIADICRKFGPKLTIIVKGTTDLIYNDNKLLQCLTTGSNRRCGGQGDLLSGILTTFAFWAVEHYRKYPDNPNTAYTHSMLAAYSACCLTRTCNRLAFQSKSRSMLATDMIQDLPHAFNFLFN